eukprot:1105192-Pyramimonas_sp.AAC.1
MYSTWAQRASLDVVVIHGSRAATVTSIAVTSLLRGKNLAPGNASDSRRCRNICLAWSWGRGASWVQPPGIRGVPVRTAVGATNGQPSAQ